MSRWLSLLLLLWPAPAAAVPVTFSAVDSRPPFFFCAGAPDRLIYLEAAYATA